MNKCFICKSDLSIQVLTCKKCNTSIHSNFNFPRLARLDFNEQNLAEELILSGGNLKELALKFDITYPTLKKRVNELVNSMQILRDNDEKEIERTLKKIDTKKISPQEGLKIIKGLNYEL